MGDEDGSATLTMDARDLLVSAGRILLAAGNRRFVALKIAAERSWRLRQLGPFTDAVAELVVGNIQRKGPQDA